MNYLKTIRLKSGLTQLEVAKRLKFSRGQYLSNCERGLCQLSPHHFKKIAKLYKVPVESLIKNHLKEYEQRVRRICK